jgi:hypothetical protein
MDQRGFSADPSDTASPLAPALPAARLRDWAALASRRGAVEHVPTQREHAAA